MNNSIITVTNLNKIAHKRVILSSVSFEINKRSLVSLIGPNGAGKSTLIKILLGFDQEYDGEVSISDDETIAYIPQIDPNEPNPTPLSVREYIAIGTTPFYSNQNTPVRRISLSLASIKHSLYCLYTSCLQSLSPRTSSEHVCSDKQVNDFDLETIMKHVGLEVRLLDQSFWNLSGGERQRIAIARALLIDPTVLVLDEPLSAVDYASRGELYELIRHLQQDHHMTVILVSHDIDSVLPISDRILCLNQTLHEDCHSTPAQGSQSRSARCHPCELDSHSIQKHIHHHC